MISDYFFLLTSVDHTDLICISLSWIQIHNGYFPFKKERIQYVKFIYNSRRKNKNWYMFLYSFYAFHYILLVWHYMSILKKKINLNYWKEISDLNFILLVFEISFLKKILLSKEGYCIKGRIQYLLLISLFNKMFKDFLWENVK